MPANLEKVQSISRIAAADFRTTGQYRYTNIDANGKAALAGAGDRADGIILGKADVDQAVEVGIGGRLLVELGATVAAGATLQVSTDGVAITQTSTNPVCGTALEAGVAGDIISTIFAPQGAP